MKRFLILCSIVMSLTLMLAACAPKDAEPTTSAPSKSNVTPAMNNTTVAETTAAPITMPATSAAPQTEPATSETQANSHGILPSWYTDKTDFEKTWSREFPENYQPEDHLLTAVLNALFDDQGKFDLKGTAATEDQGIYVIRTAEFSQPVVNKITDILLQADSDRFPSMTEVPDDTPNTLQFNLDEVVNQMTGVLGLTDEQVAGLREHLQQSAVNETTIQYYRATYMPMYADNGDRMFYSTAQDLLRVNGDITDPAIPDAIGSFDMLFKPAQEIPRYQLDELVIDLNR